MTREENFESLSQKVSDEFEKVQFKVAHDNILNFMQLKKVAPFGKI